MILFARVGDEVVLEGALAEGEAAYVDADWIDGISGELPALTIAEDGTAAWGDPADGRGRAVRDDAAAAERLLALGARAAAAVGPAAGEEVEVLGSGLVALAARSLLECDSGRRERPRAAIETTGSPAATTDVLGRLADLGTIALAGEPRGRWTTVDLYSTVHLRGLRVVGVPRDAGSEAGTGALDGLREQALELLGEARLGEPLRTGAAWYRVVA